MIDKNQLDKTFIRNEGKLVDKWLNVLGEISNPFPDKFYLVYEHNHVKFMTETAMQGGCGAEWLLNNGYREVTLKDFQEEVKEETPYIDWSRSPEGYDYWVEYVGNMSERPSPDFHKLTTRGYVEVYEDTNGEYHIKSDKDIVVHERPTTEEDNKKIIQKYVREDFKTRGQALDSYDSGVVLYTPCEEGYQQVNESNILENFGQLFTLEEREETWQDVAQEFIKSNHIFDEDEFLLEMFSDDYSEYHEPMKQLAKLIVENSK